MHCFQIFSPSPGVVFVFGLLWKSLRVCLGPICLFLLLFLLPWETDLRKLCCALCQRTCYLCSLLGVLKDLVLNLSLSAIFILILWMVRGSVLTSLIYMHHGQVLQVKWYFDILLNIKKLQWISKPKSWTVFFFFCPINIYLLHWVNEVMHGSNKAYLRSPDFILLHYTPTQFLSVWSVHQVSSVTRCFHIC